MLKLMLTKTITKQEKKYTKIGFQTLDYGRQRKAMIQLLPSDYTGRGEPSSLAVSLGPETEIRAWESHGGWTL